MLVLHHLLSSWVTSVRWRQVGVWGRLVETKSKLSDLAFSRRLTTSSERWCAVFKCYMLHGIGLYMSHGVIYIFIKRMRWEEGHKVDVTGQSGYLSYVQYIRHLRSKGEVKSVLDTEDSRMELDYLDHLQSALQPCFDNLEFGTYEVCEYRKSVVDTHPSTLLFVLFLSTKHFFSSIWFTIYSNIILLCF